MSIPRRFVVIDDFTNDHAIAYADNPYQAALSVWEDELQKCLSPKLVEDTKYSGLAGGRRFVDEATLAGWGPGCKFAGQRPQAQVIVIVLETGLPKEI